MGKGEKQGLLHFSRRSSGRSCAVVLRLFATRGFPPSRTKPSRAYGPPLGFCPRSGPSALLTTAPQPEVVVLRCSQRAVSHRLGQNPLGPAALSGLLSSLWSIRAAHNGSATYSSRAAPVRDARLPADSDKTRLRCAAAGLLPSLRSIRAAHDGSATCGCQIVFPFWLPCPPFFAKMILSKGAGQYYFGGNAS